MKNKHGRIVSKKKHATAKRENRLVKAGFLTKKGHFGFIKNGSRKHMSKKHSRKMRGGGVYGSSLRPSYFNGAGVKTSGVDLQFVAGNAG
jgi:hypothetical protein